MIGVVTVNTNKMQPVRLVLGFSPGSASEQIARAIAPAWSKCLGRSIEIELRPGDNGVRAACFVAKSAADGQTVFMATLGTHVLAYHLASKAQYDPLQDFAPVSLIAHAPLLLACHPSLPAGSTAELIDLAGRNPGELTYATSAIGGAPHLAAELFQAMAGIQLSHVRYDETEKLYDDLEAGAVSLSFNNIMSMLPRCKRRALRALAVTGSSRSAAAPDLPTIAEAALPGYAVSNWLGIVAPRTTPHAVVYGMAETIATAVHSDNVARSLESAGVTPCGSTPDAFAKFMAKEIIRWGPVVARFRDLTA
ncbi:MAG: tripartite tricarboxylate transporter substrate-binding protein [Patescibacteria group bacterium]